MIFFKNLKNYKNIVHGILERKDGSINPFSNPRTKENILRALRKIGWENVQLENLIFAEQVHGSTVHFCPSGVSGYIKLNADGLISETKGHVLVIKTADCLPLLFYHPKEKRIGAIHIGREGLMKGIVERMIEVCQGDPSFLIVGIGPHIRSCCYYLRGKNERYAEDSQWKKYIQKRGGRFYFDLTEAVREKLIKFGVKKENIEDCKICTFCEGERFYSFRKKESEPNIYQKENFPCFGSFIGLKG